MSTDAQGAALSAPMKGTIVSKTAWTVMVAGAPAAAIVVELCPWHCMLAVAVLVALVGPGLGTVIMAVVLIGWTRFARVVRSEVLVLREQDYVTAARLLG